MFSMTRLAQKLSIYYTRKKKRVVFSNHMNIQSLALKMYEALVFEQVDTSVISRVLRGERLFTVKQLEIFCTLLQLSKDEKVRLFFALPEDYLTQKGFSKIYLEEFYSQKIHLNLSCL